MKCTLHLLACSLLLTFEVLDVFTPMHANPKRDNLDPAWDFGIASGSGDDFDHFVYRNASFLEYTDPDESTLCDWCEVRPDFDLHGAAILDIDGDGLLDLFIVSGGGQGHVTSTKVQNERERFSRTNMLFWGSLDENGNFKLVGGRTVADEAGLGGWDGRTRYMNFAFIFTLKRNVIGRHKMEAF